MNKGNVVKFSITTAMLLATAAAAPASALTFMSGNLPLIESREASRFSVGGERNGFVWEARSTIIGQTPTSDVLPPSNTIGGGNPIYYPAANKSGTVALIMEYQNGDRFICSGSVVGGGMSIATAGHCVSNGGGVKDPTLVKTTAYFFNGNADERTVAPATGAVAIEIERYHVAAGYTGEVIDQNDIAILRLASAAPVSAQVYDLYTPTSLRGTQFEVAGYGTRSTVGGASGNSSPAGARTGFLREGDNIFDYRWGDDVFQDFFTTRDVGGQFDGQNFFGFAEVEFSYVSDFDNGLSAQSQARRIANAIGLGPIGNINFNNNGVGAREVGIAGGDSGGPGFVDGKLASINSYGLTFGANFGDLDGVFNAGFGEFSGYVPVYIHKDWIESVVPEPGTWAMMIAGFGFVGASMRRRRAVAA